MSKSEGSQHIYINYKTAKTTEFGNRVMEELGNIRGLETDKIINYILIPNRRKDKNGKEETSSWSIHQIHPDENVKFKINDDEDRWLK